MLHAILVLAQCSDPAANRRYALANSEIPSLHKGRVDRPATPQSDLFDRTQGTKHHPVLHPDQALTPVLLDDVGIQQLWQWPPTGLRPWSFVVATLCVNPPTEVAHNSGE